MILYAIYTHLKYFMKFDIEIYRKGLLAVDWTQFETAYGMATKIPEQLIRLVSEEHDIAMQATHELWCGLCHQHAYVSSSALPAYDFLLDVLKYADDKLALELLDIFSVLLFALALNKSITKNYLCSNFEKNH